MEAALSLGYGHVPSISLSMPSTKLQFGLFHHSSISVSSGGCGGFTNWWRRRQCYHLYSHGPLAFDRSNSSMRPSGNYEKGVGKVVGVGAIGASLALACALSIIGCCGCKMNLIKAIAGPKQQVYQKAPSLEQIAPLAPRKMALKSLLDVTVTLASKEGRERRDVSPHESSAPASRHLPPSKDQIDQIKEAAVRMMKLGQPDEALYMLKNECRKYEMSEPETAYFMNMALVEILICQGKYEEAFEFMSARDLKLSGFDVQPTLYKAILCTILDREEEAQELWEDFARSNGGMPPF